MFAVMDVELATPMVASASVPAFIKIPRSGTRMKQDFLPDEDRHGYPR